MSLFNYTSQNLDLEPEPEPESQYEEDLESPKDKLINVSDEVFTIGLVKLHFENNNIYIKIPCLLNLDWVKGSNFNTQLHYNLLHEICDAKLHGTNFIQKYYDKWFQTLLDKNIIDMVEIQSNMFQPNIKKIYLS